MKEVQYWIAKAIGKIKRNEKAHMSRYFRKAGMKIGGGATFVAI